MKHLVTSAPVGCGDLFGTETVAILPRQGSEPQKRRVRVPDERASRQQFVYTRFGYEAALDEEEVPAPPAGDKAAHHPLDPQ